MVCRSKGSSALTKHVRFARVAGSALPRPLRPRELTVRWDAGSPASFSHSLSVRSTKWQDRTAVLSNCHHGFVWFSFYFYQLRYMEFTVMLLEAWALGLSCPRPEFRCHGNATEGCLGPPHPGISPYHWQPT